MLTRKPRESGQAVVMVVLGIGTFLMAAVGLAIDGSHLYVQRQLAQAAADSAAQAGIMSIYNGTYNAGTHQFAVGPNLSYSCGSSDNATPCYFAQSLNSFNTSTDTVTYISDPTGVSVSSLTPTAYPAKVLEVTVTRNVPATLMALIGWSSNPGATSCSTCLRVSATGIAAIVSVNSPVPIIVTHPTRSQSFFLGGSGSTSKIQICGGPGQSIQVNSSSNSAVDWTGNPVVDLSHAGPADPGDCSTGTGASFGVTGGPTNGSSIVSLGTTGFYIDPALLMADPLSGVSAPGDPSLSAPPGPTNPPPQASALDPGTGGCPAFATHKCDVYFPGKYTSDITINASGGGKKWVVFAPGIYYMYGTNFTAGSNGNIYSATTMQDNVVTTMPTVASCCGTGTGWGAAGSVPANAGLLVYMTGSGSTPAIGAISVSSNSNVNLVGTPNSSSYKGILFFADRNAASQTHSLDGGGGLVLKGTIYTNSNHNDTVFQTLQFQGNAGSSTILSGEIITSVLNLQGTPGIIMNLNANVSYVLDKLALVQ